MFLCNWLHHFCVLGSELGPFLIENFINQQQRLFQYNNIIVLLLMMVIKFICLINVFNLNYSESNLDKQNILECKMLGETLIMRVGVTKHMILIEEFKDMILMNICTIKNQLFNDKTTVKIYFSI